MTFAFIGLLLCIGAAFVLMTGRSLRWNLAAMAAAQLGSALLVIDIWPLEQAAIKLVGGWMATALLGAALPERSPGSEQDAGALFRFLVFGLLVLLAWSVIPGVIDWFSKLPFEGAFAGVLLVSSGFVRSGMVREPLQVVLSVLMAFAGFGVIYAHVESSSLMTALLSVSDLGLAFVGAHLAAGGLGSEPEGAA